MARRRARPTLRLVALLSAFGVLMVAVAGRLVFLQVVQAQPLELMGAKQRVRAIELPAERGTIFDRGMVPLAQSVEARAIYADPRLVDNPAAASARLAPLLGVDPASLVEKLTRPTGFVYLARVVSPAVTQRILALDLPFIGTHRASQRVYPDGTLAGQVLGFVGIDNNGLAGLESTFDDVLRGVPGQEVVEQDPHGRPIPQGRNSLREPKEGKSLVLTLDEDIQFFAESALARGLAATRARDGVALVMDSRTGEVLAMANGPALDPSAFGAAPPFLQRNRVLTDAYEPGSVNKVITAAAAIEAGIMTPETTLRIPGGLRVANKTFRDFHPHGTLRMTYAEALAESSNIGTIEVALKLGKRRLYAAIRRFGLGSPSGIGFPGESSGILPPLDQWSGTSIGTIPIGQGIAASPLQLASVYQTIANNGVRVRPRLVRGILDPNGALDAPPPPSRTRVVSPYTAAQVRGMLVGVVEHGTGARAKIPGYLVGGKTGTARVPLANGRGYSRTIITTFAGIAPADNPRLVVLVALDDPVTRYAATTAAPVFREIMQFSLAKLGITPTVTLPEWQAQGKKRAQRP